MISNVQVTIKLERSFVAAVEKFARQNSTTIGSYIAGVIEQNVTGNKELRFPSQRRTRRTPTRRTPRLLYDRPRRKTGRPRKPRVQLQEEWPHVGLKKLLVMLQSHQGKEIEVAQIRADERQHRTNHPAVEMVPFHLLDVERFPMRWNWSYGALEKRNRPTT